MCPTREPPGRSSRRSADCLDHRERGHLARGGGRSRGGTAFAESFGGAGLCGQRTISSGGGRLENGDDRTEDRSAGENGQSTLNAIGGFCFFEPHFYDWKK